ncbi:PREDICTED: uncharacterized protein LOC104162427 [Cariama cristata]|uniref:uncharacterized protein LOC104162427 n=1 Tax=Cariama cristata TaxID=54380 RepID=UPI00052049DF|nr:PREDICTED: uncharacterized protein LOC104162427 [Cariama cristata]
MGLYATRSGQDLSCFFFLLKAGSSSEHTSPVQMCWSFGAELSPKEKNRLLKCRRPLSSTVASTWRLTCMAWLRGRVLKGCSGYDDAGIWVQKMEDFLMLQRCVKIYQPGSKMSKADWNSPLKDASRLCKNSFTACKDSKPSNMTPEHICPSTLAALVGGKVFADGIFAGDVQQDSFPARFGGIHFVNQPWYIHALYTVIRPFLKEKTRKRIFLHGNNLNSLHQLIHPEILPSEFGGMLPPYDMGTWARTLLDHEYDDDSECNADSYNTPAKDIEKDLSPKSMKRSQSVVDPGVLKRMDKNEEENMQPLLSLD